MMTLQEFRTLCESRAVLKGLWNNVVTYALRLREEKSKDVLKNRQQGTMLTQEELTLLRELEDDFINAKNELHKACTQDNIKVPLLTLNEICDLYS